MPDLYDYAFRALCWIWAIGACGYLEFCVRVVRGEFHG